MRPIIKSLLFTCAVCAVAQGPARAQPTTPPSPPNPSGAPSPTEQPSPITPTTPNPTTNPPDPTIPEQPVPGDPAPLGQNQVPPPPDTTTTTIEPAPVIAPVDVDVDVDEPNMYSYAWRDDNLRSGIGVSTILGGGVVGFTDQTMRDTTSDIGGLWNLRVTIGSHIPLGLDLSYLGTATNINGLPGGQSGTLIGTTVEGALRYNILPHYVVTPYVFGGVGWQRYDVTETNVTLSDSGMNDVDNLLEFPVGGGLSYRMNGFVGDLRGTFRAATDQNLVLKPIAVTPGAPTSDDFVPMHTWEASAAIGYEF